MQMKKILGILLAVCFLMSVTAAAVSADVNNNVGPNKGKGGDRDDNRFKNGDRHDKKIEKKVIVLKVVKIRNGIKKLVLTKYTLKSHGRVIKVWSTKEWVVVKFNEHYNGRDNIKIHN